MDVSGYTSEDLDLFRKVLDRALAEADGETPVELMARRLFIAARTGERDPERLLAVVLGRSQSSAGPQRFYRASPSFPTYVSSPHR